MTGDRLTPKEAVRAYCTECLGMRQYSTVQVRGCVCVECAFYPYRTGKRPTIKVFRKYCIFDCMNGYRELVSDCTTHDCPNHPYRFGTNPALVGKRKPSKEGIAALTKCRDMHRDDTIKSPISIFGS
jgi:hypothetical protein